MRDDGSGSGPVTVDHYLARLPAADREALERVRRIVRQVAPEATERIAYRMPVFADHGDLVGLGAHRSHLSLYTMSPGLVAAMRGDLEGIEIGGSSTLHFTPAEPLPTELVERVVSARLEENRARRAQRKRA